MPERNRKLWKALLLGVVAMALAVFRRRGDSWEYERVEPEADTVAVATASVAAPGRARRSSRFALAAAFTTLFFAGAAFTAGAGDQAVRLLDEDAAALEEATALETQQPVALPAEDAAAPVEEPVAEVPASEAAPAEPAPVDEPAAAPAPEPDTAAVDPAEAAPAPAATPATEAALAAEPVDEPAAAATPAPTAAPAPAAVRRPAATVRKTKATPQASAPAPAPAKKPAAAPAPVAPAPEIEHEHGDHATVWLNRALPDPTPASARLARSFAKSLRATSKRHGADWAIVLGVLRADGKRGAVPATRAELRVLAKHVAGKNAWEAALSFSGRTAFADQADALADLYRSVGIDALVSGFAKAKDKLAKRLLDQEGVFIYAGGRGDIEAGRIDVRVLVLIGYLARRHESVTVSSLFSGHRMFSRPGVVSAHMYGHAVDIAAVGGRPIFGNSRPGGLTEDAVRSVLLLPAELQPRQVISLLGLGGPSFPLHDHGDHIHVGF